MSKAQLESLDSTEAGEIVGWRFDRLVRAGYAEVDASKVARQVEVDLHLAMRLLERGCPAATALRILL